MSKYTGIVKFFNDQKGFGFIARQDGEKDVFVHVSGLVGATTLQDNQEVEFEVADSDRGLKAINVTPL